MESILIISIISWWFAVGLGLVQWVKWFFNIKKLRPFDCSKCMGFWLALIYAYCNMYSETVLQFNGYFVHRVFVFAILTSAVSIIIEKGMERL